MLTTINCVKGLLLTLQHNFTQNFMRINETHIAGEPLSTFQLGERRRKRTIITKLRTDAEEILDHSTEIENHMLDYFRNLYTADEVEEEAQRAFQCERCVPDGDETNAACMGEITTAEIFGAIKTSAVKKSPGSDGLPRDFYLRNFHVIHRELNLILNEALRGGFPPEFVNGVIVLVKKKDGDDTARSYRPISLLNFDYKILSRILKTRLDAVMTAHKIISPAQKCSNADRNIFQATLAIKDKIAQMKHQKQRGKLISFDLDHAFDRVEHTFLFKTMRDLGINPALVSLLAQIAASSSSRLLVNGHLSDSIAIQRSVRQGDPLSMHLFVLYLHPLLSHLERVCGNDLIVAYADDISVIVTCANKIELLRQLFCRFEKAAGAKLNLNKTSSIDVGYLDEGRITIPWLQSVDTVKVLGIIYANSIRLMTKLNWDAIVTKFAQHVWLQSLRILTLQQKVIVLNTFLTSKVWYLSAILLPYCVHTSKLTSTMGTFLWSRVQARVPMQQLAKKQNQGGLKLQIPAVKCKALLINRFIRERESSPFSYSLLTQVSPIPADLPCLKLISQQYPTLPARIQQNPSSHTIHEHYVEQIASPRVEQKNPHSRWKQVWVNISQRELTSTERSQLYLLVNEKIVHRQLMFKMQRVDGEACEHCGAAIETLKHKLCLCPRVAAAWGLLQQKITLQLSGWRRLAFEDLLRPTLTSIIKARRIKILKLLNSYITYITENYILGSTIQPNVC